MRRKLRVFFALAGPDRRLLVRAWMGLLGVDLMLRVLPFKAIQRRCLGQKSSRQPADVLATIAHLKRMVDMAARNHLYPMTCLRRALVLQSLLAKRQVHAEIRFGVRKELGTLQAHAWLEYQGREIGSSADALGQFHPLELKRMSKS
jgi:hypothetical protein